MKIKEEIITFKIPLQKTTVINITIPVSEKK